MIELRLLTPAECSLLLVPRKELPRHRALRQFLRERLPFPLIGCTFRVAGSSLPGGGGRVPILVVRPEAAFYGKRSSRRRLWIHPLLVYLLLRRRRRWVTVDWKSHRQALWELWEVPGGEATGGIIRGDALLQLARRHPVALIGELLLRPRLQPVLFGVEGGGSGLRWLPFISLGVALLLALSTLSGGMTAPSAPSSEDSGNTPTAEVEGEAALRSLTHLLGELGSIREEGFHLTVEEIEGTRGSLRLRLRVTMPDEVAGMLIRRLPEASVEVTSPDWLLSEATGVIVLTLRLP